MNKDKLVKLTRYLDLMTNKLNSPTPDKHKDHPETYRAFLNKEIRAVRAQLDAAKLDGVTK